MKVITVKAVFIVIFAFLLSSKIFPLNIASSEITPTFKYLVDAYKANKMGLHLDLGIKFFDGQIDSNATNQITHDRTVAVSNKTLFTMAIGSDLKAGIYFNGIGFRRLLSINRPVEINSERFFYELYSKFILIKTLPSGINLWLGYNYSLFPKYNYQTDYLISDNSPQTNFDTHNHSFFEFGFFQTTGNQAAGILVSTKAKAKRKIRQRILGSGEELQYNESHIKPDSLTFIFERGSKDKLLFELEAINGDKANESKEQGYTATDFYSIYRIGGEFFLGPVSLKTILSYKSFTYKSSKLVTIDGISEGGLHFKSKIPTPIMDVKVHFYGTYGKEGQSLQELNSTYRLIGFGSTIGIEMTM